MTDNGIPAADLEQLLARYHAASSDEDRRPPPWAWATLTDAERQVLARLIEAFVATYNRVYAVNDSDLLPPCWRRHPGLAADLAVHVWLWYATHLDPTATPFTAGDYYRLHLPAFRGRVDRLLGASPPECRQGEHHDTWRSDADRQLAVHATLPAQRDRDTADLARLAALHFGFAADAPNDP